MTIPKHVIVATLRTRNQNARADWVDKTLPDDVDPFLHSGLLSTLNLRVEDLATVVAQPTVDEERTP
jgi:hypothetical protein